VVVWQGGGGRESEMRPHPMFLVIFIVKYIYSGSAIPKCVCCNYFFNLEDTAHFVATQCLQHVVYKGN
jgi:hypothetical protein